MPTLTYILLTSSPAPLTIQELKQLSPSSDNLAYKVLYSAGVIGRHWSLVLTNQREVAAYWDHAFNEPKGGYYAKDAWEYFLVKSF